MPEHFPRYAAMEWFTVTMFSWDSVGQKCYCDLFELLIIFSVMFQFKGLSCEVTLYCSLSVVRLSGFISCWMSWSCAFAMHTIDANSMQF